VSTFFWLIYTRCFTAELEIPSIRGLNPSIHPDDWRPDEFLTLFHSCVPKKGKIISEASLISKCLDAISYFDNGLKQPRVYVACDGIAPIAKLNTMRKRRRTRTDPLRDKITFGTIFFDQLLLNIKKQFGPNNRFTFDFSSKGNLWLIVI